MNYIVAPTPVRTVTTVVCEICKVCHKPAYVVAFIVTVPVTGHPDSWTACVQHTAMGLHLCTAGATGHGPFQFNHKHHVFFPPLQQGLLIKKLRQAFVTFFPGLTSFIFQHETFTLTVARGVAWTSRDGWCVYLQK